MNACGAADNWDRAGETVKLDLLKYEAFRSLEGVNSTPAKTIKKRVSNNIRVRRSCSSDLGLGSGEKGPRNSRGTFQSRDKKRALAVSISE